MKREIKQNYVQYNVHFTDLLEREYTYDVYYAMDEEKYFLKIFDIIGGRKPWNKASSTVRKYAKDFLSNMAATMAYNYKFDFEGAEKLLKEMLKIDSYAEAHELMKSDLKKITVLHNKCVEDDLRVDEEKLRDSISLTIFMLEPWKSIQVRKVDNE